MVVRAVNSLSIFPPLFTYLMRIFYCLHQAVQQDRIVISQYFLKLMQLKIVGFNLFYMPSLNLPKDVVETFEI